MRNLTNTEITNVFGGNNSCVSINDQGEKRLIKTAEYTGGDDIYATNFYCGAYVCVECQYPAFQFGNGEIEQCPVFIETEEKRFSELKKDL